MLRRSGSPVSVAAILRLEHGAVRGADERSERLAATREAPEIPAPRRVALSNAPATTPRVCCMTLLRRRTRLTEPAD